MLADANMRKQISYSFSDYQKQLDTVEPSKRNCPIRKKSHMEWMINLNKNMTAIGMGRIVHEKREKWLRYRVSKKRERRENAQLQEHVIKRVLNPDDDGPCTQHQPLQEMGIRDVDLCV